METLRNLWRIADHLRSYGVTPPDVKGSTEIRPAGCLNVLFSHENDRIIDMIASCFFLTKLDGVYGFDEY